MTSKSLSTSTLSLRFMQNAHRAKQLKEVELDRAEVKDDEKWEVSQDVRDSWGISQESQPGASEVHETSYLPFLFSEAGNGGESNDPDVPVKKTGGRRVFNKKGEMVPAASSTTDTGPAPPTEPSATPSSGGRKIHPRPVSISASGKSGLLKGFEDLSTAKDGKMSKTAREAIFESGGVGTDLRTEGRKNARAPMSATSATFMKPVGVDDPKTFQTASMTSATRNSDDVIDGARQKKKSKRERDGAAGEPNEARKKSKKSKKNPE